MHIHSYIHTYVYIQSNDKEETRGRKRTWCALLKPPPPSKISCGPRCVSVWVWVWVWVWMWVCESVGVGV